MAWSQPSSRSHRLLFWSLAILAVVMVLVVAFALRRFNREMEMGISSSEQQRTSSGVEMKTVQESSSSSSVSGVSVRPSSTTSASAGSAQQEGVPPKESADIQPLTEVSVADSTMSGDGNNVTIAFKLSNGKSVQSGVRYGVLVVSADLPPLANPAYESVVKESMALDENASYEKRIDFTLPSYLSGKYNIFLEVGNESGIMLSLAYVDSVLLSGDGKYVEMDAKKCYLGISGAADAVDINYDLQQGVDIAPKENLALYCDVTNHFSQALVVRPSYEFSYRSVFGDSVQTNESIQNTFQLTPGKTQSIKIPLPLPMQPQAYNVRVSLANDQQVPSSGVTAHFVVQGPSATIQNVTLDKTSYREGEIASTHLFLSGSADTFFESRHKSSFWGKGVASISLKSDSQECGVQQTKPVDISKNMEVSVSTPIVRDCPHPIVGVSLTDEKGAILASKEYEFIPPASVNTTPASHPQQQGDAESDRSRSSLSVGISLLIVIIIVLAVWVIAKRVHRRSALRVFLYFAIPAGMLSWGSAAFAASSGYMYLPYEAYCDACVPVSWLDHTVGISASLNKSVYAPGEPVYVTGTMTYVACANSARWGYWIVSNSWNSWQYQVKAQGGPNAPEIRSIFTNVVAPSTPGNYSIRVRWYDPRGYPPWYNPVTGLWRYDQALRGTFDGTITLTFTVPAPTTYTLNVSASGASGVPISGVPSTYGGTTNYSKTGIPSGTSITLTAPPTVGTATFTGWSGSCTGTGSCSFVMNLNKSVIANYSAPTLSVAVTATPNSGNAPLNSTVKAVVAGTATGNINYTFNCGNGTTQSFPNETVTTKSFVCSYSTAGSYVPTVSVVRQGITANGSAPVTVGSGFACTGSVPASAVKWDAEEETGLLANSPWVYADPDTSIKCQYHCLVGTWDPISSSCSVSGICSNPQDHCPDETWDDSLGNHVCTGGTKDCRQHWIEVNP